MATRATWLAASAALLAVSAPSFAADTSRSLPSAPTHSVAGSGGVTSSGGPSSDPSQAGPAQGSSTQSKEGSGEGRSSAANDGIPREQTAQLPGGDARATDTTQKEIQKPDNDAGVEPLGGASGTSPAP